jgi:enolase
VRVIGEICAHYEQAMHCAICNDGGYLLDVTALDDILAAVEIAVSGGGHTLGDDVFLGFRGGTDTNAAFWIDLVQQVQVAEYIEDPIGYDDTLGWSQIRDSVKDAVLVSMGKGLSSKGERMSPDLACSAIVVRPVQCGTLSKLAEATQSVERCAKRCVVATSVRETPDTWICDAAVALGAAMLQLGPVSKGENIAKVNRLMEIARELEGESA